MMLLKLLLRLVLVDLMLRETTGICRNESHRLQITKADSVSAECQQLQELCSSNNEQERLVGTEIELYCPLSGSFTFSKKNNSQTTVSNGGRFSINRRILTISDIQPEDEGLYSCSNGQNHHNISCLTVSGVARFKTCDSNYNFNYTMNPTVDNSCSQHLNVLEGEDVSFDTSLEFGNQGDCQCIEDIRRFLVRKDESQDVGIVCNERFNNCINELGIFTVRRTSTQPYDFSLMLPSVNMNHSGTYFVEMEVGQPGVGSFRKFWKIFQLTISANNKSGTAVTDFPTPTQLNMSTVAVTPNYTTTIANTNTMNPGVSVGVGGDSGSIAGIIVGAIAACIAVLVIVVATVFIVRKKQSTRGSSKQEQVIVIQERHENITLIIERNGPCQSLSVGKGRPESIIDVEKGRPGSMIDAYDLPSNTMAQESSFINV